MNVFYVILPMFIYVLYMASLVLVMFKVRLRAVKAGEVDLRYFKAYSGVNAPKGQAQIVGRHFDNQFQLPILFFVTCVLLLQLRVVDVVSVSLIWLFVVSRVWHSIEHLGRNHPLRRARAYGVGWLIILVQWSYMIFCLARDI